VLAVLDSSTCTVLLLWSWAVQGCSQDGEAACHHAMPHCWPELGRGHAGQATMIGSDAVVAGMIGDKCYAYSYFLTAKSQCNYQSGQVRHRLTAQA
jgi:hypothetical protein